MFIQINGDLFYFLKLQNEVSKTNVIPIKYINYGLVQDMLSQYIIKGG